MWVTDGHMRRTAAMMSPGTTPLMLVLTRRTRGHVTVWIKPPPSQTTDVMRTPPSQNRAANTVQQSVTYSTRKPHGYKIESLTPNPEASKASVLTPNSPTKHQ